MAALTRSSADTVYTVDAPRQTTHGADGVDTVNITDGQPSAPETGLFGIDTVFITDSSRLIEHTFVGVEHLDLTDTITVDLVELPGQFVQITDNVYVLDLDNPEVFESILYEDVTETVGISDSISIPTIRGVIIHDTVVIFDPGENIHDTHSIDDVINTSDTLSRLAEYSLDLDDEVLIEESVTAPGTERLAIGGTLTLRDSAIYALNRGSFVSDDYIVLTDTVEAIVSVSDTKVDVTVAVGPTTHARGPVVGPTELIIIDDTIDIGPNRLNAHVAPTIHERTR